MVDNNEFNYVDRVTDGGTMVLFIKVRFPLFKTPEEKAKRLTDLYFEKCADAFVRNAEGKLKEYCLSQYASDPDKRKKYRFEPYVASFDGIVSEDEKKITTAITLKLTKGDAVVKSKTVKRTRDKRTSFLK